MKKFIRFIGQLMLTIICVLVGLFFGGYSGYLIGNNISYSDNDSFGDFGSSFIVLSFFTIVGLILGAFIGNFIATYFIKLLNND